MIDTTPFKYIWMNHTSSQKFYPTSSTTHRTFFSFCFSLSTTYLTTYIYLCTWFCKRKYTWSKPELRFFTKELFHNGIKCPFEISKSNTFSDNESFELIEVTCMSCIFLFITKNSPWSNNLYRKLSFEHGSDLYGRSMRSK